MGQCISSLFLLQCCWSSYKAWDHALVHCFYYSTVDLLLRHKTTQQLTVPIIALLTYLKARDHPLAHVPTSLLLTYHLAWDRSTGCWVPGALHPPLLPAGPASILAALSAARSASWPTGPGTRQGSEDSNHIDNNNREFIECFLQCALHHGPLGQGPIRVLRTAIILITITGNL